MEHLDNDMDDLFQKAGELYPLKTTESDWDAVAGKLRDENFSDLNAIPGLTSRGNRNKRRWLLLLLLIPLGFGIAYTSGLFTHQNDPAVSEKTSGTADKTKPLSKPIVVNSTAANNKRKVDPVKSEEANGAGGPGEISETNQTGKKSKQPVIAKTKFYQSDGKVFSGKVYGHPQNQTAAPGTITKSGQPAEKELRGSEESQKTNPDKTSEMPATTGIESDPLKPAALTASAAATAENKKPTADKKEDSAVVSKALTADSSLSKKKSVAQSSHSKGIYVGLLVGPDVSTVKFQSVKQLGYSAGLSVGYRFNDRLAVETGLLLDKKYYYTNGEYFKKSNGYYYPSSNTLNGNCNMLEIPLTLRYDFKTEKNHGFFAKAGLSTYLMTRQYYVQDSSGVMDGEWPVTKNVGYPFSIITLSGGYEYSIDKKTKIQIEPYLKIPLRGLGEGDLPISSFGIYFGITRSFR